MASIGETVAQVGTRLGLKQVPQKKIAYGLREGYLVELASGRDGSAECVLEIIRYGDPAHDAGVRAAVAGSADIAGAGIKAKRVTVADGVLLHKRPGGLFRTPTADAIGSELDALLRAVRQASPPPRAACRLCGSDSGGEPILVNDVVDRVCGACIDRLQHEVRRARERYDEVPMNLPLAVLAAAVLAVAGAAAWAGVAIATNRVFWLVAIGAGLAIGWGTTKAAGKGGVTTQTVVGLFTMASVLLGELLLVAYHVQQRAQRQGARVDWYAFAAATPSILWDMGRDTVFAVMGGLIGAWYATRQASKPKIEVSVDRG